MTLPFISGGCGFLGRCIVEQLLARGETDVRVFDIRKGFEDDRVKFFVGSICNEEDLRPALRGVTTVYNTVSPPHGTSTPNIIGFLTSMKGGEYDLYFKVNVTGTKTLLKVSAESGVKQFIHTSSSSVVFDGTDIKGSFINFLLYLTN